ncbi:MAG: hypothetical protein EBT92_19465 [Planctomycetes bacterium]|nr:hypothetical protein [Planctomycetota bacterium]NDE72157.1 hypothetical protein [Actinomycetota bacterium]
MTRKDYLLISKAIASCFDDLDSGNYSLDTEQTELAYNSVLHVARRLADRLSEENPRFDYKRFLTASTITLTQKHRSEIAKQLA